MVLGFGHHHHHKEEENAYNSFYEGDGGQSWEPNKMHEGVAGAAAFYAMKKYEERREAEGFHDHTFAREMLAAVTAAEVEKLAERTGMSYEQKERAKQAAQERAHGMYETYYMQG
eukprot:GHUV01018791.1.p3 GENE.GHUV01018791.1~~GHUV01018791.1.p3  ORF type:complete len:115 (+),score=34.37 GHUV01018791.1:169-513(+)